MAHAVHCRVISCNFVFMQVSTMVCWHQFIHVYILLTIEAKGLYKENIGWRSSHGINNFLCEGTGIKCVCYKRGPLYLSSSPYILI